MAGALPLADSCSTAVNERHQGKQPAPAAHGTSVTPCPAGLGRCQLGNCQLQITLSILEEGVMLQLLYPDQLALAAELVKKP
jgi:hypothetical protein